MPETIADDPPKQALDLKAHAEAVDKANAPKEAPKATPPDKAVDTPKPLSTFAEAFDKARKAAPEPAPADKPEPTEPADELDKEFPEPKTSSDWKRLKTRAREFATKAANLEKDFQKKIAEAEAQLAEAKKRPVVDPKDIESLRKERDELKTWRDQYALESSPEFQNFYTKKFNDAVTTAKEAAGEHAEQIEHLLQLPPSKRRQEAIDSIFAELPSAYAQQRITMAFENMDSARRERAEALKSTNENLKKLQEKRQKDAQDHETRTKQLRESAIEDVLKHSLEYEAFKDADTTKVTERKQKVRQFFTGDMAKDEALKVPVLAQEALYLKPIVEQLRADKANLEATIAKMTAATPGDLGLGTTPMNAKVQPKSFFEVYQEARKGAPERK